MAHLTVEEQKSLVQACTYKDWVISVHDDEDRLYIQIEATTPCSVSGELSTWKSGKTYLSPFMCRQEVVGAVFGAIERAEAHEMRKHFRYKGASIFNPHLDPDVLAEVAKKKESFNMRDNAMSMEEVNPLLTIGSEPFFFKNESSNTLYTFLPDTMQVQWGNTGMRTAMNHYTEEQVLLYLENDTWHKTDEHGNRLK